MKPKSSHDSQKLSRISKHRKVAEPGIDFDVCTSRPFIFHRPTRSWFTAQSSKQSRARRSDTPTQGTRRDDPFICSLQTPTLGEPLNRPVHRRRFHTACRVLGWDRLRNLTIHLGRYSFINHVLACGRTLAEVKAAAGHASLLTTSVYLHVVVDEGEEVGALFA
jgi:integrase